ncbi:transmembrane protein 234 isoform X2 [Toxotes jaculatrix]|uniref:transmembrane protein 234 isoform X2 n=1 Tax=Toxotes jaculatrix TaxID=941984 RepID=UPI001B3AD5BB|nr:transmembrane protein 234 isoform X2 [Toxotes jaculatrix]
MNSLECDSTAFVHLTMVTVVELLSLCLVSVLWGCTNPFLKRGTEGIENVTNTNRVSQLLAEVKFLFLNIKYLVPFLLNQSGSLVYYYTLSTTGHRFIKNKSQLFLVIACCSCCQLSHLPLHSAHRQVTG